MEAAKDVQRLIYVSAVVVAFFASMILLYVGEIRDEKFAYLILGALIAEFRGVGSYLTGSTASSASKDATIAQMATTPTVTTTSSPGGAATVTTTGLAPNGAPKP